MRASSAGVAGRFAEPITIDRIVLCPAQNAMLGAWPTLSSRAM
jgi:hypothetical protein